MVLKLFQKRSEPLLGVDISASAVKLVELSKSSGGYQVEAFGIEQLPANTLVDERIQDTEVVGNALSRLLAKTKARSRSGAAAVGGSTAIIKTIEMDAGLSEDDIEAELSLEADEHIPYPLDEVALDFEVIGPTQGSTSKIDVQLVACKSETVDEREVALITAGVTGKVVEVEGFALERAYGLLVPQLEGDPEKLTVGIVDIGAWRTSLTVLRGGKTVYHRVQPFGGAQLTEQIQNHYGRSLEEAEFAKRRGGLPDDYESEVLAPFEEVLAQQISRALQFFFAVGQYDHLDHLFLAGGTAVIKGLDKVIQEQVGVRTRIANPFLDMSVASRVDEEALTAAAPALLLACGLALRSFD